MKHNYTKKLQIYILIILVFTFNIKSVKATEIQKTQNKEVKYVRLSEQDYESLREQAFVSTSILQRIRDLETLYKQIKGIVETVNATVKLVKEVLNIDDNQILDFLAGEGKNEFEHVSGVIMSPGFVTFVAETSGTKPNFDSIGVDSLEVDIYYNKNLFTIDHIEGDKVFGREFKRISLPQTTSAAKDRVEIPLSDVLSNRVEFKVYLAPINPETIKVGDQTALDIKYYKRVTADADGVRTPPILYSFAQGSPNRIEVRVK